MKIAGLDELLEDHLKDLYSAENQLVKALPRMAKAASDETLVEALEQHLDETKGQVERLDQIAKLLDYKLTGKKCAAMEGLIEEGKEAMDIDGPDAILDMALIAAAQRVEHYEISAYGTARAIAEQLGHKEVARLLQETLEEESAADEKLTGVTQEAIFPQATMDEDESADEEKAVRSNGRTRRRRQKAVR